VTKPADIVDRLRDRAYSFKAADSLMEEAAAEIESLRLKAERLRITPDEFGAIAGLVMRRREPPEEVLHAWIHAVCGLLKRNG
jgi:hypothetical protein